MQLKPPALWIVLSAAIFAAGYTWRLLDQERYSVAVPLVSAGKGSDSHVANEKLKALAQEAF